jgi:hypothetical protein
VPTLVFPLAAPTTYTDDFGDTRSDGPPHPGNDLGNDNRGRCVPGVACAKGLKDGARVQAGQLAGATLQLDVGRPAPTRANALLNGLKQTAAISVSANAQLR